MARLLYTNKICFDCCATRGFQKEGGDREMLTLTKGQLVC